MGLVSLTVSPPALYTLQNLKSFRYNLGVGDFRLFHSPHTVTLGFGPCYSFST